jgi:hypothetical protein
MNVETGSPAALQCKSDVRRRIDIQPVEPDRMTAG